MNPNLVLAVSFPPEACVDEKNPVAPDSHRPSRLLRDFPDGSPPPQGAYDNPGSFGGSPVERTLEYDARRFPLISHFGSSLHSPVPALPVSVWDN